METKSIEFIRVILKVNEEEYCSYLAPNINELISNMINDPADRFGKKEFKEFFGEGEGMWVNNVMDYVISKAWEIMLLTKDSCYRLKKCKEVDWVNMNIVVEEEDGDDC